MTAAREVLRSGVRALGLDVRRTLKRRVRGRRAFSKLGETQIIADLLSQMDIPARFFVDIGAGDGVHRSNILALALDGWSGIAVELNSERFSGLAHLYQEFPDIRLVRSKVTPENVCDLLAGCDAPASPGVLSVDIDGYDYDVVSEIFRHYRPVVTCVEINERIPPPIKFRVKYDLHFTWDGGPFHGVSVSYLGELCEREDLCLVCVNYNNAFLVPRESCSTTGISPEQAYAEGYVNKIDRHEIFHWNRQYEELLTLSPADAYEYIKNLFADREGQFLLEVDDSQHP